MASYRGCLTKHLYIHNKSVVLCFCPFLVFTFLILPQSWRVIPFSFLPVRLLVSTRHLYLSGMWLGVIPIMDTKKRHVFIIDWTKCSKNDHHSRSNSQHNWGGGVGLHGHPINTRIFTFIMNKTII